MIFPRLTAGCLASMCCARDRISELGLICSLIISQYTRYYTRWHDLRSWFANELLENKGRQSFSISMPLLSCGLDILVKLFLLEPVNKRYGLAHGMRIIIGPPKTMPSSSHAWPLLGWTSGYLAPAGINNCYNSTDWIPWRRHRTWFSKPSQSRNTLASPTSNKMHQRSSDVLLLFFPFPLFPRYPPQQAFSYGLAYRRWSCRQKSLV